MSKQVSIGYGRENDYLTMIFPYDLAGHREFVPAIQAIPGFIDWNPCETDDGPAFNLMVRCSRLDCNKVMESTIQEANRILDEDFRSGLSRNPWGTTLQPLPDSSEYVYLEPRIPQKSWLDLKAWMRRLSWLRRRPPQ